MISLIKQNASKIYSCWIGWKEHKKKGLKKECKTTNLDEG